MWGIIHTKQPQHTKLFHYILFDILIQKGFKFRLKFTGAFHDMEISDYCQILETELWWCCHQTLTYLAYYHSPS